MGIRYKITRYLAYTLELLVFSMLQVTPGLFPEVAGARPVLLLAAALSIAIFENEITAMAFGIFAGLLIDFAGGGLLGFHGMVLAVTCYVLAVLYHGAIRTNLLTALLATGICLFVVLVLQWLFFFLFRGYSHAGYALTHHYLPRLFYTFLFVPLFYFLNHAFFKMLRTTA